MFAPRVWRQLDALRAYVTQEASAEVADGLTNDLIERCLTLAEFAHRGTPRDDLRPGLRTIPFRRRATIGYVASGDDVVILTIAYAGQDLAGMLRGD
ncbi:type II toxin-antitoxin system RelE/ParE family toxin [Sphingomonas sp.]|uniref:type II toxin-antitoxin system RelE/ParE family toxin n=1 Tax=Sphingomonas sp. TaxID=28214 RepID=UPI003BABA98B